MEIKTSNAYEHLRLSYIINIVNLIRVNVSATLVSIFRNFVHKGYITKSFKNKLNILHLYIGSWKFQ